MSSDHAGINRELGRLQREMSHALAHIDDARKVRLYLDYFGRKHDVLRDAAHRYARMDGARPQADRVSKIMSPSNLLYQRA